MRRELILAVAALLWTASPALADPTCTVEGRDVEFSVYNPFAPAPNDSTGSVVIRCDCFLFGCGDFAYSVSLTAGQSGNPERRRMSRVGGFQTLDYQLYSDPARTRVWGSGFDAVTRIWERDDFGETRILPVYGRMPARQSAAPGIYGDAPLVLMVF